MRFFVFGFLFLIEFAYRIAEFLLPLILYHRILMLSCTDAAFSNSLVLALLTSSFFFFKLNTFAFCLSFNMIKVRIIVPVKYAKVITASFDSLFTSKNQGAICLVCSVSSKL